MLVHWDHHYLFIRTSIKSYKHATQSAYFHDSAIGLAEAKPQQKEKGTFSTTEYWDVLWLILTNFNFFTHP